ncbi:MAG: hypothetical protein WKG07_08560 [Hymenobacter sp.]
MLAYRQLSRRLGITTKTQREELFAHLKELKKAGRLELLQNDEYRLANPTDLPAAASAAKDPKPARRAPVATALFPSRCWKKSSARTPSCTAAARRASTTPAMGRDRPRRRPEYHYRYGGAGYPALRLRGARGWRGRRYPHLY